MNNQEQYKLQMLSELADLAKGLASDKRLMILQLLIQAPKTVEAIAKQTNMSIANTSRHLQILKKSNFVKSVKDGNYIIYSLANYRINNLLNILFDIGIDENEKFRNLQNLANSQPGIKTITLQDAKKIAAKSFILDARLQDEFNYGHITGAVNIPFSEIDQHLSELPKNKPIIVYCRGRLCPFPNQITQKLNQKGFDAYSLNSSWQDWQN